MNVFRTLFLAAALVAVSLASVAAPPIDPLAGLHFPAIQAENLANQSLSLPREFTGQRNLVLIAFQHAQQKDVSSWLEQEKQFAALDPALRTYELAAIGPVNAAARWFIRNGMRSRLSDSERGRTIVLFSDKAPLHTALGLAGEQQIYAILLDRDGRVLWRAEGRADEAKAASLKQTLQALTHTR